MNFTTTDIFNLDIEYEDEFGRIHPHILSVAERVWRKSGDFYSKIIQDQQQCLETLMKATALVSRKYNSGVTEIKNPTSYLHATFRRLILAEIVRRKRHCELETEVGSKQIETDSEEDENRICQKILVNQLRARMDDWMREVFDLQIIGYQYKDLVPKYGSSENVIRSRYSKNLLKLKNELQAEMANIERELKI